MANDVIIIEYQANIQSLENSLHKVEKDLLDIQKGSKASMAGLSTESKKASNEVEKVGKSVNTLGGTLSDLSSKLPFAGAIQQAKELGGSVLQVGQAAQNSSKGFAILRVAVTAALGPIGLIVGAIVALIAFFKRTDEGATKLEGILGALGAVLNDITGFIAEFGSKVFDALSSVESFQQGLKDLGEFIVNNVLNRFKAILVYGEAIGLLFEGEFAAAAKKGADAFIQMNTGITDGTDKLISYGAELKKAAQEAYDFAVSMDRISDAQRDLNVEISEHKIRIAELIKQSKNHSLTLQERINKLKEANALDEKDLKDTLVLEQEKLDLIKERNKREQENLNRIRAIKIAEAKTDEERIALQKEALHINDNLAQEEADQQIKINNLKADSVALQELNNAKIAALREQQLQEDLKAEETKASKKENIQKQALLDGQITEEEFSKKSLEILLDQLNAQKGILIQNGKDTTEIDKAILDAQLKNRQKAEKQAHIDYIKALESAFKQETALYKEGYNEQYQALLNQLKTGQISRIQFEKETAKLTQTIQRETIEREIDLLTEELKIENLTADQKADIENKLADERKKLYDLDIDNYKKSQDKKKAITQQIGNELINISSQVLTGLNDLQHARATAEIENERAANDKKTNDLIASLEKRKDAGVISEQEFNAQKLRIQDQAARKESQLKKKQFEADQKASINKISIDEAVGVIKTFSQYGFTPAGIIAAAALTASAEIEKAFIRSQPVPKFKEGVIDFKGKGTTTSDSNTVQISNRESVIKAKQSIKYTGALKAINDDYFDNYVHANYVVPALQKEESRKRSLAERQAGTAENIMRSLEMNGFGDMSHLERLTKSNKKVIVENIGQLPSEIGKEISRVISNQNYMR